MKGNRHVVGKRIAQALVALVLALIVVQAVSAADTCECPSCPAHACMHLGCPNGNDGTGCATATSDACRNGLAIPFASPTNRAFVLHFAMIVAAAPTPAATAASSTAGLRHALAPPATAPPPHIAYCRLRR